MKTSTTISPAMDSTTYSKRSNHAQITDQKGEWTNLIYTTEVMSSTKEAGKCSTSEVTRVKMGVNTLGQ